MSQVTPLLQQPKSHEWETPIEFFRALDEEFGFFLDAAASVDNTLCHHFYSQQVNGLAFSWAAWVEGAVWCNPPYGTQISKWVRKCFDESQDGATVVMLIPARTETAYWHDYVMRAAEIRFVRGRLRFSGSSVNAPFPSAVVVFRFGHDGLPTVSAIGRDGKP